MIEADAVPAIMDGLRRVSDDWLKAKAGAEKGFSMGFFDEAYLSRFPVAVIEREAASSPSQTCGWGPAARCAST